MLLQHFVCDSSRTYDDLGWKPEGPAARRRAPGGALVPGQRLALSLVLLRGTPVRRRKEVRRTDGLRSEHAGTIVAGAVSHQRTYAS